MGVPKSKSIEKRWRNVYEKWKNSGMDMAKYARTINVNYKSFHNAVMRYGFDGSMSNYTCNHNNKLCEKCSNCRTKNRLFWCGMGVWVSDKIDKISKTNNNKAKTCEFYDDEN